VVNGGDLEILGASNSYNFDYNRERNRTWLFLWIVRVQRHIIAVSIGLLLFSIERLEPILPER